MDKREWSRREGKTRGGPFSPSPRPSPAAARVSFTGRCFAGEGGMCRWRGFQPVRDILLLERLSVPAVRWLPGVARVCRGELEGWSERSQAESLRRGRGPREWTRESGAGERERRGGPFSPSPRPSPAAARVSFSGRCFAGEGRHARHWPLLLAHCDSRPEPREDTLCWATLKASRQVILRIVVVAILPIPGRGVTRVFNLGGPW